MIEDNIYKVNVDTNLLNSLKCPSCKADLNKHEIIDIFELGLSCKNNHRFYVEIRIPLSTNTENCAVIEWPLANDNELVVIQSWLTDFNLRSKLNNQLANIIRRILEIKSKKINIENNYEVFKYCIFCSNELSEFQQNDVWVKGLECIKHHRFLVRNGLGFQVNGYSLKLQDDMSNSILVNLVEAWLRPNKFLEKQLHEQIKRILKDFLYYEDLRKNS